MSTVSVLREADVHVVTVGPVHASSGTGGSSLASDELVSVWNAGSPEIVFDGTGQVVTSDAS